jgi:bacillithiol biosynthesis cysteine-adding enzyme BshC
MKILQSFSAEGLYSKIINNYVNNKLDFLGYPTLDSFKNSIVTKNFPESYRQTLVSLLTQQHSFLPNTSKTLSNIEALKQPNAFTVTTGHQLCLFTGPLLLIIKIAHTIALAKYLNANLNNNTIVPVFWLAGEDHDFEEINHCNINHTQFTWKALHKGKIGDFTTEALQQTFQELKQILPEIGINEQDFLIQCIEASLQEENYVNSFQRLIVLLFEQYGLVTINADNKELKQQFKTILNDDLQQHALYNEVNSFTNTYFTPFNYKIQVNARPVNLFYTQPNYRERLHETSVNYITVDNKYSFTKDFLLSELENNPENFSPNVLLRPLYQEYILPNLAYVGGGSEVNYWLSLVSIFKHYNIPFPNLLLRSSFGLVNKDIANTISANNINIEHLLTLNKRQFLLNYVKENNSNLSLEKEFELILNSVKNLENNASVDLALLPNLMGLGVNIRKKLIQFNKKIYSYHANKPELAVLYNAIASVVLPKNKLQERHLNILSFCNSELSSVSFINSILENIGNPLMPEFRLLEK